MADSNDQPTRRDFIHVASVSAAALGAACIAWPLIDQLNPAADTLALSTTEFDVSGVTVKDIQKCIDNRIVNYNHQADQSADNKYTANYKLQLIEDKILPKYLISNKQNLKEWFD